MTRVVVVVLAAGSGRRLGLGPKAHVRLGDESFLERIVRSSREAGLTDIVVVASRDDAAMPSACEALGLRMLVNGEPSRGMSSSVRIGLEAISGMPEARGALVWPVDVPRVRAATIRLIANAVNREEDVSAHPVCNGASGHPVGLGRDVVRGLAASLSGPLRDALTALGVRRVDVVCDDPGVVTDINTPNDLRAAREER